MSKLFGVVNRTIRKIRIVQKEGNREVSRELTFYSLDAITAVGYRVNSKEVTDFRIWATNTLKEFVKKGFVLNDEFLKNGPKFGKDYFKELLERIRSIRTSERRILQQEKNIEDKVFEKIMLKYLAENYKEEILDENLKCIDMYYYSRDLSKKENY